VALDCARVLAKGGRGLHDTDLAARALPVLKDGIEKTSVVGRRGHLQGAFTIKELRELVNLYKDGHDASFRVSQEELDLGNTSSSKEELGSRASRPKIRIDKLLRDAAAKREEGASKEVSLRFLLNPLEFLPSSEDSSRVGGVRLERTELQGGAFKQVAVGTGEVETLEADLVLVSIGYQSLPLPEMGAAFDRARGRARHVNGRVSEGLYVSGWLKRGPSGIIGTNIGDARDTVETIVGDLEGSRGGDAVSAPEAQEKLLHLLRGRGVTVVDWDSYKRIDDAEKSPDRLRSESQPREKIVSIPEMLRVLDT